ncbi:transposase [Ruoffia tabacinasalis]|uniref:transposase n=1 Tax=Ruoffia tabacinasalis TaxID=87458 RepID=UPI0030CBC51B
MATQLKLPTRVNRDSDSFEKYQTYIHDMFMNLCITNGPIEAINSKIKVWKQTTYSYRNDSHFRDRILLMTRLYDR